MSDDWQEGQRILDEYNRGLSGDVSRENQIARFSLGDPRSTFKQRQQKAVEEKGFVLPGLNGQSVNVTDIPMHQYAGSWEEARKAAINDAKGKYTHIEKDSNGKEKRVPTPQKYDNFGQSFNYNISGESLNESVNSKQVEKSLGQDAARNIHLSVLNHLDEVINNSIEVEEHPDYKKGEDGKRKPENGYNSDLLIHRFAGTISVDGKPYRVMTLMKEYLQPDEQPREYAYDVAKIDVLDDTPNTSTGAGRAVEGPYPLAKLLNKIGKSYEKDKLLLSESAKSNRKEEKKNISEPQFSISSKPFYSNAEKAVEGIKQQKADEPMFFKTRDGHAYGYTYKGKIYIDPRIATSETPVHEYSHLWAEMKRQTSPEEWEDIKRVMLTDKMVQPIIEKVKREYPELTKEGKEDDFIEEIITQFSGKRGSERLREIANEIAAENGGVFGKAEAVTAMQRLKNILNHFWAGVAKMMGWKYRNANQIADRIMADMLNGVNPRERMRAARDERRDMRMEERDRKQSQLDIINENNPADESLGEHTWIKSVDDIKNFDEAMSEYGEDENLAPDYTAEMARKAKETGEITVYSSKPIGNGIFVTPSKMEAKNYAGEGRVYSKRVRTSDVAWIDGMQGQYAKVDEAKMQKVDGDIHSDNFKNFFGDWENDPENASKVVDKNGKPMVVLHGTGDEFYTFDIGQLGKASGNKGWFGEGFYFTPWEDQARGYAKDASRKSGNPERLMPVYLNIRNPQVVDISERDSFVPEEGTDGVIVTITLPKGSPFRKKGVKFDKDRYIYTR